MQEITLPSSVSSIGKRAFLWCSNLCGITIPSGVTSIGDDVFHSCRNLREITIPSGVTSIGERAFSDCMNLREINVAESNKIYRSINGVLYTKDLRTIICYPEGKGNGSFVIPLGVTRIENGAFKWCASLQEITLPPNVTSIGKRAFFACCSLKTIILPSNITSIGADVFVGCENLQRINIPAGTLEKFKKLLPDEAHLLHEI